MNGIRAFFSNAYPRSDAQFVIHFLALTALLALMSWFLIPSFFVWVIGLGAIGGVTIVMCSGDGSIRRVVDKLKERK